MNEKVEFPLKPWQKALINTFLVAGITILSMVAAGDLEDINIWKAAIISGGITCMIQIKSLLEKDLDDSGKSFTPLMFVKVK